VSPARPKLDGVFPPVTTPFAADGDVDAKALAANIRKYNAAGLAGYVVVGSTGESVYLSEGEKLKVWEAARGAADSGKVLAEGMGSGARRGRFRKGAHRWHGLRVHC